MTMTANIIPTHESETARGITAGLEREPVGGQKLEIAPELGNLCHSLNQPLMAISGLSGIIAMQLPEDDPLQSKILKITRQIEKMGSITREIMAVACREQ